ncbi:hypothetical protein T492DRAFT_842424 [Pavlovales sp. CCMP2436]|nr:hypothetical protein T492DRAFT_842424 [Pavlovales sp. CCMP2436]
MIPPSRNSRTIPTALSSRTISAPTRGNGCGGVSSRGGGRGRGCVTFVPPVAQLPIVVTPVVTTMLVTIPTVTPTLPPVTTVTAPVTTHTIAPVTFVPEIVTGSFGVECLKLPTASFTHIRDSLMPVATFDVALDSFLMPRNVAASLIFKFAMLDNEVFNYSGARIELKPDVAAIGLSLLCENMPEVSQSGLCDALNSLSLRKPAALYISKEDIVERPPTANALFRASRLESVPLKVYKAKDRSFRALAAVYGGLSDYFASSLNDAAEVVDSMSATPTTTPMVVLVSQLVSILSALQPLYTTVTSYTDLGVLVACAYDYSRSASAASTALSAQPHLFLSHFKVLRSLIPPGLKSSDAMASLSRLASLVFPKLEESGTGVEWSRNMLTRLEQIATLHLASSSTPVDPALAMAHLQSLLFSSATAQPSRGIGVGASPGASEHIISHKSYRDLAQALESAKSNTEIVLAVLGIGKKGTPGGFQLALRPLAQLGTTASFPFHATFINLLAHVILQATAQLTQPFNLFSGSPQITSTDDLLFYGLGNTSLSWLNKTAVALFDSVGAVGFADFMDRVTHVASLVSLHPIMMPELSAIVQLDFVELESALSLLLNGLNPLAAVTATFSSTGSDSATRLEISCCAWCKPRSWRDSTRSYSRSAARPSTPAAACTLAGLQTSGAQSSGAGVAAVIRANGKRPSTAVTPVSKRVTLAAANNITTMVTMPSLAVPASPNLPTSMFGSVAFIDDPASDQVFVFKFVYSRSSIVAAFQAANGCAPCLPVVTSVLANRSQKRYPCPHAIGHADMAAAAHSAVGFSLDSYKLATSAGFVWPAMHWGCVAGRAAPAGSPRRGSTSALLLAASFSSTAATLAPVSASLYSSASSLAPSPPQDSTHHPQPHPHRSPRKCRPTARAVWPISWSINCSVADFSQTSHRRV